MRLIIVTLIVVTTMGCDANVEDVEVTDLPPQRACPSPLPYADELVSFNPGANAGFGDGGLPEVVLGPPSPGPPTSGSIDVLSLGVNGEVIVAFNELSIVDGPGPDFIVWENPFWVGGDPDAPFAELGEVSVSEDGLSWVTFPCDPTAVPYDAGCAGWRPRRDFEVCALSALDPELTGGDPFDLADIGLGRVSYVRIRDLSEDGEGITAGFDLDSVGGVNVEFTP